MGRSVVEICNGALDELPAATIQSIDDPDDIGARACKRRFRAVFEDLIGEHDYDAAVVRATLAAVDNDRPGEWAYAYRLPDGTIAPRRVLPSFTAAYVSTAYILQPGQRVWTGLGFYPGNLGAPFRIASNTLYTNTPEAVLEFVSADAPLSNFRALFFRAFELELAARICLPVIKDGARQRALIGMAEVARQRAMADDLNSSPDRTFDFISEEAMVRIGNVDPAAAGYGYGGLR